MNKITINFVKCTTAPAGGYQIYYREVGSSEAYVFAGTFYTSPAVFYDTVNPPGTCYEGYLVADCGNDVFGNHVTFNTCNSSIINPDNSSCGTILSFETADQDYVNHGLTDLHVEGASEVDLTYQVFDRPNRFTLYENGSEIATSGWKGYAPYPGVWGASLSTSSSGTIVFNPVPGRTYQVRIESGNAGSAPYDISDNFELKILCK